MRANDPIEPFQDGVLATGDGHMVYWEWVGNPDGIPAIYLHGGPGSGATVGQRRLFDPTVYRTLIFDQRGSGRSAPLAETPDIDLSTNTTHHLVADIEALRQLHQIERWTVLGLSWGTTLALAYAQTYPQRVSGMVLGLVTTTSRREVDWITEDMGRLFPDEWEQLTSLIPDDLASERLIDAYATMLFDEDPATRFAAAQQWCRWEDTHVSLAPGHSPSLRYADPDYRLRFARLVTHYWRHAAFLEEDQLLRNAGVLDAIPGVMLHGRYDVSSPMEIPWRLSKVWSTSRLHVMDAGHGGDELLQLIAEALSSIR